MNEPLKPKVAIVGAGLAGLAAAAALQEAGFGVSIFDKGRFVGGRLASRTSDENQFDYGAQFFTAKDPRFIAFLEHIKNKDSVKLWTGNFGVLNDQGKIEPIIDDKARLVASPAMRSLAEAIVLENDLNVSTGTKITLVRKVEVEREVRWSLEWEGENPALSDEPYQYLILNMPPLQAQNLWTDRTLSDYCMTPCIAVMVSFSARLSLPFDGIAAKQPGSFFSWLARDSSKPGRPAGERWVLHIGTQASDYLWQESDEVILKEALFRLSELAPLPGHSFAKVHRWRYALSQKPNETKPNCSYIFDKDINLGYCGDWLHSPRIEGAYLSGIGLARAIIAKHLGS